MYIEWIVAVQPFRPLCAYEKFLCETNEKKEDGKFQKGVLCFTPKVMISSDGAQPLGNLFHKLHVQELQQRFKAVILTSRR